MAASNPSRDVSGHHDHSGGTSRPPLPPSLPRPWNGYIYRPVPFWERKFCHNAYDFPWETFCQNKRFIALYKNVLDWDDSGAFKNFKDAKKRFRAKHFGEPYEDPVLDPDMYIGEVDHDCKVDPELVADLDKIAGLGWGGMANLTPTVWGGPVANLIPTGWGQPVPNRTPTGWGEQANLTPDPAWGGQGNQTPGVVWGGHPHCSPNNRNNNFHGGGSSNNWHQQEVGPGHTSSGTGMMLNSGVRIWTGGISSGGAMKWNGGSGSGRNWNGGSGSGGGGGQQAVDPGHTSSGTGRMLNDGVRIWTSGVSGGGAMKWNGGGGGGAMKWNGGGGSGNSSGRNWNGGSGSGGGQQDVEPGRTSSGTGRMLNSVGRMWTSCVSGGGGNRRNWNGGSGSNWNGGGRGNKRNQDEVQHQQRNAGGMQRNQDEGRHQMRSGGGQQQGQGARKMEWRPVQHNRTPKDDPAA